LAAVIAWAILSIVSLNSNPSPGPGPGPDPQPGPGPEPWPPRPDPEPGPQPEPWPPGPAPQPSEWDLWYKSHKTGCRQCQRPLLPMCREARDMKRQLSRSPNVWVPPH
jgi:hypothetical protein